MVEWIVSLVAKNAVGFLVKAILNEEFAKEIVKDYAKDFFKGRVKKVLTIFQQAPLQQAVAEALKEFLQLVEDELKFRKLADEDVNKFNHPLKQFIHDKSVKEILAQAFDTDCDELDYQNLANIWNSLNLPNLPAKFNWQLISDRYLRKCHQILADSADLQELLNTRNLIKIQQNTQEAAGIIPDFDLRQYQEAIRERYVNLKLDSLDTSGYTYNELRLWKIFITPNVREVHKVLPQVYELPKEHLRYLQENNQLEAEEINLEELEQYKRVYLEQPVISVLDIINQPQIYKYIVILGDPGSGKSTLLQYLALDWVEKTLDKLGKPGFVLPPIPLLIELRTYMRNYDDGHCKDFLDFFHQSPGAISHLNQHHLQAQLKAGNVLVMFDGLDEVFNPGKREDLITAIHRFTNEYPNVQAIVTSRVIGYKPQRLRDAQFRHFMLQDLNNEQIQDFINRWHDLAFKDEADQLRKKERLQKAINTSKAIAELAVNPLLLTMMAILNRSQELPRERAELYKKASEVLLHKWDVERALAIGQHLLTTIDYKDKQAMLRHVAYYMQTNKKGLAGNLISASNLERIFTDYLKSIDVSNARDKAKRLINQLRTRNFMLCFLGGDYYAFVHRTFLEYFCAWEFVWQFKETQTLTIEQLKCDVFGKYWRDETWHEVLRLIAGMIEPRFVGIVIDYLISQEGEEEKFTNLFLAAKCLAEVRNRAVIAATAAQLFGHLKCLSKYDLWYYYDRLFDEKEIKLVEEIRTQAVVVIATTWKDDLKSKAWLRNCATVDENWYVRRAAVQELARNFQDDTDTIRFLKDCATCDESWNVRLAAVQELARNSQDETDTICFLKVRATVDVDADVRRVAVEELARNFKNNTAIASIVQNCAIADEDPDVRCAAIKEWVHQFPDDPNTIRMLQDLAIADEDTNVRCTVVAELAHYFPDDTDTIGILQDHATVDEDADVRRTAIHALARNFPDLAETLSILRDRIGCDENAEVRRTAVEELARNFQDCADTIDILKHSATADESWHVRKAAIQVLAQNFQDDVNSIHFLKYVATTDESWQVRRTAVEELARNFQDNFDTISFLKDSATADEDSDVRQAAVQVLARKFQDNSDIIDFLKNRATVDEDADVRSAAVEELAQKCHDDSDIISFLRERATGDRSWNVRRVCVEELGRNFLDEANSISFLKNCATTDKNHYVRRAAMRALVRNFQDESDMICFLKIRATTDNHWVVRRAAVEELAHFKNDTDIIGFLKNRAATDESWYVRQIAVQALARNFKNQAGMFEVFYNCAVNDSFERQNSWQTNPRRVALEIILKQYPRHPQTLPLLRERANNDLDEKVREFAQKKLAEFGE